MDGSGIICFKDLDVPNAVCTSFFPSHHPHLHAHHEVNSTGQTEKISTSSCQSITPHPRYCARNPICALKQHSVLLKSLEKCEILALRATGFKCFSRHLWYLSEVNIALALFNPSVDVSENQCMVQNIKMWKDQKNLHAVSNFLNHQENHWLIFLFLLNTWLFQDADASLLFLDVQHAEWEQDESFCKA